MKARTYSENWGKNILKNFNSDDVGEQNYQLLCLFQQYLLGTGTKEYRVGKLTNQLKRMILFENNSQRILQKPLDEVEKNDVLSVVAYINQIEGYTENRRCIKQFYKWFKKEDERFYAKDELTRRRVHKLYDFIETEVKRAYKEKQIDPSTILTDEDIEKVVSKGCRTIKEKAFIKFLHETGLRAGEILGIKVKHIEIQKNIGIAHVDGKTGKRTVQFAKSLPYVVQWLELHPYTDDPESMLWLGESPNRMFQPLNYRGVIKLVRRCFTKAKVNKIHNLHWFRHSRATLNAPHWTELIMCKYFGWTPGSKQVRTYVHLCNKQIEDAFLLMNGLQKQEEVKLKVQICGCGTTNDSSARYCYKCGNPLSVTVAVQDKEIMGSEMDKSIKLLMEIAKQPELMQRFMEFKSKL